LYGTFILPVHFQLAVADARHELADASRLKDPKYCYNFLPEKNKTYSAIVSSAGIGILLLAAFLFIWLTLAGKSGNSLQHHREHGPLPIR
jgi:hypothetical protein